MAYPNKTLHNPVLRQNIRFIQTAGQTNGRLLEMEATYFAASKEPPPHYHPRQDEEFTVLEGELSVRINGYVQVLKSGDCMLIPKKTVHSMWNQSGQKTVVNWKVQPAFNTEHFLETAAGLVADGKTNKAGMPPLLQVALLANKYAGVFRLSKPPFAVQRVLFALLTPVAYLKGFRSTYRRYLD